jgi:hypothetical protein
VRKALLYLVLTVVLVATILTISFAQSADPRIARSTWQKEMDYIKNGQFSLAYKTLVSAILTSPTLSGTVTNSAVNNNTGIWQWSSDGDTLKLNMYKAGYVLEVEIGNTSKFYVDSTGIGYFAGGAKLGSTATHYITDFDSVKFGTQNKARWYKLTLNTGLSLFVPAYQAADTTGKY